MVTLPLQKMDKYKKREKNFDLNKNTILPFKFCHKTIFFGA